MKVGNSMVGLGHFRDGRQCGDAGLPDLARQRQELERGIDLKGQWLVSPVQEMGMGVDTATRVLRRIVVAPPGFTVSVGHGYHWMLVSEPTVTVE